MAHQPHYLRKNIKLNVLIHFKNVNKKLEQKGQIYVKNMKSNKDKHSTTVYRGKTPERSFH